ncbi:anti-sigma factor [Solimonas soli]|uniref:anti-sigma factor n=1 Tax=Solimonas soli TaxID=413479 RepID=UPI0004BC70F3|nr:anti-sigma factor [Solimonas soli]
MDPRADDERSLLAAEYALGTLEADARREAEALLARDEGFRRELWWWERRFAGLGLRLAPLPPRPLVWLGLQRRIAGAAVTPLRRAPRATATTAWAWTASAAALVLAVALGVQMRKPPQVITERVEVPVAATSYVAVLQMPQSDMHWTVSATPARDALAIRAGGQPPAAVAGHDVELWLITDAGPVSLGLLPVSGELRRALPAHLPLAAGRTLAVSLEPQGGSPTGKPTGPVLTTAAILQSG